MKTELKKITIRDLVKGYTDDQEKGVQAFSGKLNVRPPYQREFVYNPKQRDQVINSIMGGFPLNVMYWVALDDGTFELLDGQQRTISICQYLYNKYSVNNQYTDNYGKKYHLIEGTNLGDRVMNYELFIYHCFGDANDIINWFRVINTAGEKLNDQEILNAVYNSKWLTSAKKWFSRMNCPAKNYGEDYLKGSCNRQDYLRTVIKWKSNNKIAEYMNDRKADDSENAEEIWKYFKEVIDWVRQTFTEVRPIMKGVEWGYLYEKYGHQYRNSENVERTIKALIENEDIKNSGRIYKYYLTKDKRDLQFRTFKKEEKLTAYENQNKLCNHCKKKFKFEDMEGDHIVAWSKGGETLSTNLQMLCKRCNGLKSNQ